MALLEWDPTFSRMFQSHFSILLARSLKLISEVQAAMHRDRVKLLSCFLAQLSCFSVEWFSSIHCSAWVSLCVCLHVHIYPSIHTCCIREGTGDRIYNMIMDRRPQNVMRREFRTIWVLLIWSVFRLSVFMLSPVWLLATLWIVAHQVPLSMGFSWQEYWSESHIKDSNQSLSDSALETSSSSPHSIAQGHLKY